MCVCMYMCVCFSHPQNKTQPVTFKQQCGVNVSRLAKLNTAQYEQKLQTLSLTHLSSFTTCHQSATEDNTNPLESHIKTFHT